MSLKGNGPARPGFARRKNVALVSLGCAKNLVDSEVMLGHLKRSGFHPVGNPDEADAVVVNTCGFIRPARDEAEDHIWAALDLKKKKRGLRVFVVGCYVERARDRLEAQFPEVDHWMGVRSFDRIADALLDRSYESGRRTFLYSHESPRLVSTPGSWAYVKVSEGCSHRCGFCSIPLIKGPYVSRALSSIIREVRILAGLGVREVNLVSHDTTSYGRDKGVGDGLAGLLGRLIHIRGLEWIRVLYGYPDEVTGALLEVMLETKVCPYLDIPFQHSDPKIVRAMKRGMDGGRALKLLERIRKKVPGVAVRTSLVVGFPGEGKKEFASLKRFVREADFEHLGVFAYSPEEGTPSFGLSETVGAEEKDGRRGEIMEIQAALSLEKNRSRIGEVHDVLIERPSAEKPGAWVGRGRFQAPEVDGTVIVEGRRKVSDGFGPIVKVRITGAETYDLRGRVVP